MPQQSTQPRRERAILAGLEVTRPAARTGATGIEEDTAQESIEELVSLAESAGAEVILRSVQSRPAPDAATLVGSGKAAQLAEQAEALEADLVLFDRDLTPTQLRNLEKLIPCKVLDRTQLILDIFAKRARTREGQIQVELAQLNYLLPRLTGRGAAMSRLGGGIGTRGPGETKLETDRRRIFRRISRIEAQLESVRAHRSTQRSQRQAVPLATVALVGYTNAGKSTLFNRLTGAGVLADAKMFATLDPTVRHIRLPSHRKALLSDTVGFIRNLPATLVKAFRATLEEVTQASLLLHLVDASSPRVSQHVAHVTGVLHEIGAAETPQILVLNKIDQAGDAGIDARSLGVRLLQDAGLGDRPPLVAAISARRGDGIDELIQSIDRLLPVDPVQRCRLLIPANQGAMLHMAHEHGRVLSERWTPEGCDLEAEVPESILRRLRKFAVEMPGAE